MSSIHALQSSTTSRKLLESVRSLRPLFSEALSTSGCYTNMDIHQQDPALDDVKHNSNKALASGDEHRHNYAQCVHEELASLHSNSFYQSHIHIISELDVNAQYHGHDVNHVDMHVQHGGNPWPHVGGAQTHNEGDAAVRRRSVDVHHGQYYHHEYGNYEDVYHHQEFGQQYIADAIHLSSDAHHQELGQHIVSDAIHLHHGHGHGHEYGYRSNSIIASMDNHIGQQQISEYHNHHLQQHISSEMTHFLNTILFEAPASYSEGNNKDEALGASDDKVSNVSSAQDRRSWCSEVDEAAYADRKVNCKELPCSKRKQKGPPKIMSKLCASIKEDSKLLNHKGKATISSANLFSKRRRKKRNDALFEVSPL